LAGDPHVGGEREGEAAAAGRAMHQRDDRLRAAPHLDVDVREVALEAEASAERSLALASRLYVEPGAERAASPAHHHHAAVAVVEELAEIVGQFADHRRRDGVQRFGPVQRQPVDGAAPLHMDRLVVAAHPGASLAKLLSDPSDAVRWVRQADRLYLWTKAGETRRAPKDP